MLPPIPPKEPTMEASFYKEDSGGRVFLFFRPAGMSVIFYFGDTNEESWYPQAKDAWYIQWRGSPEYNSGYSEMEFQTFAEAKAVFDECEADELAAHRRNC